ncbi:MAG: S-methyl-5'-thioadenosine phosphorylase [Anaerolineales bacterium]|nr:S-methyl-5'-thioadenosine phosphorylase [Anaerolineales bacterium]
MKTDMEVKPVLGVIGGSGLYDMPEMQDIEEITLTTPFGEPSTPIIVGRLEEKKIAFIARHGNGHTLTPGEVNYRANIFALKSLGVERIVSVSACGSLREDFAPGDIVVPDQLFDNTRNRNRSFFGDGMVAHVSVANPFCLNLSAKLHQAIKDTGANVHLGGAFITIEGPRFSTRIESNVYRAWGMSIIGMTTSPEAFLAREAEICYTVMAHVTDYDVWHLTEDPVTVEMVIEILHKNTKIAQEAIQRLIQQIDLERDCECPQALSSALITQQDTIPAATRQRLGILVDKYLK